MKKSTLFLLSGAVVTALSACGPSKTLYSWYDYEDATYKYTKNPDEKHQEKMMNQYAKVLQKQKGTRKTVQPGLYAEYGYMLVKAGKKEEGLELMNKEIELYPESKAYVSRIIEQLKK
ncbi:MAG: DUF4810 domain-containing protein [Bacteroidales bacterium]|nr:DUF4810 domain-containing protein [Bacteroidales bacterium]MCM1148301.1 DUF4810 domain-containing protein [Bacteroidales bacterium]MCM1206505.1 DUF4810 domain-containing protein [Bacillota bacterium]MCM1510392.1 DUF4810 domain-containing protein [Clostridium sp.]